MPFPRPHNPEAPPAAQDTAGARPRAWAEIDLGALGHNLRTLRRIAGEPRELILVVKGDAYGHGAADVARHAAGLGVGRFGVGTVDEALELHRLDLRCDGAAVRTLVLGTIVDAEAAPAVKHGIELGVHSQDRCEHLARMARELGRTVRVHLNVDTGMGRLGVLPERALDLLRYIQQQPGLVAAGLMTHIAASSPEQGPAARDQLRRFDQVVQTCSAAGLRPDCIHVGNSAAILSGLRPLHDAIRPGVAAYGLLPTSPNSDQSHPEASRLNWRSADLRPVLSLKSQVVFFKDLPEGAPIGYDGTHRLSRPSRIGTLPLGYHDGLPWRVHGKGHVLVGGRRAPILGRVSMDYTTIDLTDLSGTRVGDEVVVIGSSGTERITALDVARWASTIPYEITCSVGHRVQRRVLEEQNASSTAPGPSERTL